MKKAENVRSCLQRDGTECEGYAGAQSAVQPGNEETAGRSQRLLEAILYRDNLNRAYTVSLLKPRLMCYNISGDENEEIRDNH